GQLLSQRRRQRWPPGQRIGRRRPRRERAAPAQRLSQCRRQRGSSAQRLDRWRPRRHREHQRQPRPRRRRQSRRQPQHQRHGPQRQQLHRLDQRRQRRGHSYPVLHHGLRRNHRLPRQLIFPPPPARDGHHLFV